MKKENWINWKTDKEKISKAIETSSSKMETIKKLGYYPSSITKRKLNEAIKTFHIDISHFSVLSDRWKHLPSNIKECTSISSVLKSVGLKDQGDNHKTAKRIIREMKLDTSHFKKQGSTALYTMDSLFKENSEAHRKTVKDWIIKNNLLPYECNKCGNTGQWHGEALTLELDHINGINTDNRLKNLRWLCPNCHSQTETFGNKNKK